jgi:hypothetical protein
MHSAHIGVTAPEEFGGLDMGYQAHCIAMEVSNFPILGALPGGTPTPYYAQACMMTGLVGTSASQSDSICYKPVISCSHGVPEFYSLFQALLMLWY